MNWLGLKVVCGMVLVVCSIVGLIRCAIDKDGHVKKF